MKKKRICTNKRQLEICKNSLANIFNEMECGTVNLKGLYNEALELNDKINTVKMKLTR